MPKPVLPAIRRRKGFESVRKGYRSADARLRFFEKQLFYRKLTVGFRGWNLQLLVSFGAVGSLCRGGFYKKLFFIDWSFRSWKSAFFAYQKISICRKLYALLSKASRFRNRNTACSNNFLLSSKAALLRTKSILFAQTFPYSHPKQSFSTLHFPFAQPLTYCLQRMQLFFCCSL